MDIQLDIVSAKVDIHRDAFTQDTFDQNYATRYVDFSIYHRLGEEIRQMSMNKTKTLKRWCVACFPPLEWLRNYNWKAHLIRDVVSGLTVGVMNIPQGMAYGMLAGLPPVYGLYTSFFLPLIYACFGTSLHMSVGVFAVISLMVATAVDKAAPLLATNGTYNNYTVDWFCGAVVAEQERDVQLAIDAAVTLTFLVGCIFGLLHMGFLSVYLSDQLVEGMTTGSAVLVLTSQMGSIFGITGLPDVNGVMGVARLYGCLFTKLNNINWTTMIISFTCIVVLIIIKEFIDPPIRRRFKMPVPAELLVLIAATSVSYSIGLHGNYRTRIVGEIPTGLQSPRLPTVELIPQLLPNAIGISVVIFSIGISIGKLFGKKHDYEIKANQEWFALGITHFISSFFSCHCGGSSLSRSVLQEEQGSKSQIASVVGAVLILLVLLALGPLFRDLPTCVLAAIIVVNLKGMFMQFKRLMPLWGRSKPDFMIWVVSFISVILLDITFGLAVSVLYALLTVVFRSQWPDSICLGRMPDTELYKGLNAYENALEIPGIKIYRFESHLYFANADMFRKELDRHTGIDVVREKYKRKRKLARKKMNVTAPAEINIVDVCREEGLKSIIIDCSPFPYVDMTGLEALRQVYEDYEFLGIHVAFACVKVAVRQMMVAADFFKRVPKTALFPSVHDAVCILSQSQSIFHTTESAESANRIMTERL